MKSISNTLPMLFLIISFMSCTNPSEESKDISQQEQKALLVNEDFKLTLKSIGDVLDNAVLEADYETLLKYHTDDVILMPNFRPAIHGKNELREQYEKEKKEGIKLHAFNSKTEKVWILGDEVYEYGTYGLTASSKDSDHPYGAFGSYFMIWEKQPDSTYLIKFLISNLDHKPDWH